MKYILGVYGKTAYNLYSHQHEYTTKILVSQDVLDFLNNHDIEITSKGERLYIMNNVKYIYLGIDFEPEVDIKEVVKKYQYMYDIIVGRLEELIKKEYEKNK